MDTATSVSSPILSKIGAKLMELTLNQIHYFFCYKSIVDDLRKEEEKLKLAQDRVQQEADRAIRNTEEIEKDVQKWLKDVRDIVADVLKLEEEIQVNKRCCLTRRFPNWIWQYQLSKKAEEMRKIMSSLRSSGKFNRVSHAITLPGIEFLEPKDFELFESSKSAFDQLMEALKSDTINIIGLYGIKGVGKTTLARVVGNRVKEEKIFDEVVMVNVSQNSVENIQDQLAEFLSLKFEEKTQVRRAERLYLRFTKLEKKNLIILDDVLKRLDLKTIIGISSDSGDKGCKILLTTDVEQVCIAMNCQRKIRLNVLSEQEALSLFKKYSNVSEDSAILNALAIEIARECKGLPLALVTIANALKDKDIDEWKVMSQKIQKSKLVDIEHRELMDFTHRG